jgi:carbonic anhydrase
MSDHTAEAIIVTCIDFRLQESVNKWIAENFATRTFDRVAFGGGIKNLDAILSQIDIAVRLHSIKKAILVNHEDCGAYGAEGTYEKHIEDLRAAKTKVKEVYPNLEVGTYYLHLDGTFELIN